MVDEPSVHNDIQEIGQGRGPEKLGNHVLVLTQKRKIIFVTVHGNSYSLTHIIVLYCRAVKALGG